MVADKSATMRRSGVSTRKMMAAPSLLPYTPPRRRRGEPSGAHRTSVSRNQRGSSEAPDLYQEKHLLDDHLDDGVMEDDAMNVIDDAEIEVGEPIEPVDSFNLNAHLTNGTGKSSSKIDLLKTCVSVGDVLGLGRCIRDGMESGDLTEVEVKEVSKSLRRPDISMTSYCAEMKKCTDMEDLKNMFIGDKFLQLLPTFESKKICQLEAKVHGLSKNTQAQHVGSASKKQLHRPYSVQLDENSIIVSLNEFYSSAIIIGTSPSEQMTHIYTQLLKESFHPAFQVWMYSFRPSCRRQNDKHFISITGEVACELTEFGMDVLGLFLPEHIQNGTYSADDAFLATLEEKNKDEEVERRRKCRPAGLQIIENSIGRALRNIRSYHYDLVSMKLVPCAMRSQCKTHLRWDSVRKFRMELVNTNSEDGFTEERAMIYQNIMDNTPHNHLDEVNATETP